MGGVVAGSGCKGASDLFEIQKLSRRSDFQNVFLIFRISEFGVHARCSSVFAAVIAELTEPRAGGLGALDLSDASRVALGQVRGAAALSKISIAGSEATLAMVRSEIAESR